jgi:hypothetical protein
MPPAILNSFADGFLDVFFSVPFVFLVGFGLNLFLCETFAPSASLRYPFPLSFPIPRRPKCAVV